MPAAADTYTPTTTAAARRAWMARYEAQMGRTPEDDNGVRGHACSFVDRVLNGWRYGDGDTPIEAIEQAMRMTGDLE